MSPTKKPQATAGAPDVRVSAAMPAAVDVVAVAVWKGRSVPAGGPVDLDIGYLEARGFEGRVGETAAINVAGGATVLAVGLGDPSVATADTFRRAAAAAVRASANARVLALNLLDALTDALEGGGRLDVATVAQALAEGALLGAYTFTTYKSAPKMSSLGSVFIVSGHPAARPGVQRGVIVGRAVRLARDLINDPPGEMTPRQLAAVALAEGKRTKLDVRVLDERGIAAAGLGGLLGVARGSTEPPRLLELLYEPVGAKAATPTVALIGKGITFDSGGLSLKTGAGMMTMKTDMSGAAAVIAAMSAIAEIGAPVRVLGLCPATDNMPSGTAIKPGDVLRIRNGKTVEVLNTDAEGRLVLADGLSLAVEAGVDAIVDIATLTGAVTVALGKNVAGLMASDDEWGEEVEDAAARAGEAVWLLPLPEVYRKDIDSEVADIKNIGTPGGPGTLIAGLFLKEFTGDIPWAHLDIAGTARSDSDDGYVTKGGTGWGVRTLIELVTSGSVVARGGATRRARWAGKTPVAGLAPSKKR